MNKLALNITRVEVMPNVYQKLGQLPNNLQKNFQVLLTELNTGRAVIGESPIEGTTVIVTRQVPGEQKFEVHIERKYEVTGCRIIIFGLITPEEFFAREEQGRVESLKRSRSGNWTSIRLRNLEQIAHLFRNGEALGKLLLMLSVALMLIFGSIHKPDKAEPPSPSIPRSSTPLSNK